MSKSGGLPSLFIGSSTESVEIGIVEHLAAPFRERFDVRPWTMGFSPGNNTLQSILDAIAAADFAIFVFAADDIREMRESRDRVTRDNVILELGIGIAKLGIDRVAVLREDGVAVPTDLAGTVDVQFTHGIDRDPALLKGSLRQASERIDVAWASHYERLRRLGDIRNDYPFGIDGALERLIMDADGLQRRLATAPPGERVAPVVFEREVDCVTAYCDGLRRVESRFWTTSFLSSGFWTGSRAEILTANTSMLERLGRTDAGARRIFLLRAPVEEQIEFEVQQQRNLVRAGCREDARRFDARLGNLESNIRSLIAAGCDVRIAHDGDELHSTLPASMAFDELDLEISLYDDFRVDVFRGGRIGRITGLEVYFARDRDFPAYLSSAMAYFGRLWESATPALDYLAQLRSRLQRDRKSTRLNSSH